MATYAADRSPIIAATAVPACAVESTRTGPAASCAWPARAPTGTDMRPLICASSSMYECELGRTVKHSPRRNACNLAVALLLAAVGCEREEPEPATDAGEAPLAAYARVQSIFAESCAYERCHAGAILGGGLSFARGTDYASVLVGVPACEYERFARVEPGAPEKSWLYIKLTAEVRGRDDPYADYILFEPAADWDADQRTCRDRTEAGTPLFGQRMPLTAPNMLPDAALQAVRAWIAAGALH